MKAIRPKKGFTLIELLVVISIIGILSAIALVSYTSFLKNARDARRQSDLKLIQSALERYHADNGYYPAGLDNLGSYLNNPPSDPVAGNQYLYKAYTPDRTSDCDNLSSQCLRYCLYANLENSSRMSDYCPGQSGYNLEVSSPD